MKKRFLLLNFLLFIIYSFNLLAINFPEKASKVEEFIPKGWKSIIIKKGDLNKDKIDDVVLLIQKTDSKNFRKAESPFYTPIDNANFNPIIMLVLFKDKDKNFQYKLVAKNEDGFIVPEGKSHEEVLQILEDSNPISIKNNTLKIRTYFQAIRAVDSTEYIFRYQNNRFELIGLEAKSYGTSGSYIEDSIYSINFSTKKLEKYILMEDMTSGKTVKEEKVVESIDIEHKYILDAMTEATASEILDKYVYKSN